MGSRRVPSIDGHTFQLRLTSRTDGPVRLSASNLSAIEGQEAVLLDPAEGRTRDLRTDEAVSFDLDDGGSRRFQVAVGPKQYVEQQKKTVVPEEVTLTSYPNPVQQQGTIAYTLPDEQTVRLTVYDVLGREVATLEQGRKEAGRHTVRLETSRLASGVYFGRLQAGDRTLTQKITVVR
jgi:hypothetical protein